MAVDMFMKLGDVEGESVGGDHVKEIDVLSWSWGMSQSGTTHIATGGGAGKVNVQDLSFTKWVDSATHRLIQACCKGDHFPEAKLTVRKAGGTPVEYFKVTMTDVIISSISSGGSGGEDRLTENVTLNFGKFKVEYTPQEAAGGGGAVKEAKFDIAKNAEE
jgi:type VI secretion system secreted protein Hcp